VRFGQREVNDRPSTGAGLWIERSAASDKPISPDTVEDCRSLTAKKIEPASGGKRLHTVNGSENCCGAHG
jgi:hypothetical protein